MYDLRSPDKWSLVKQQLSDANSAGTSFETVHIRKDGTVFPIEVKSFGVTVANHRMIMSVIRDTTEKKRAREKLHALTERLRITLRSIGDAVIATDTHGCVTLMNPSAEHLTGWTQCDALGRHLSEVFRIINEETREFVDSPVDKVLALGIVVGLANHTVLIGKDGTERAIADSAAPILNDEGVLEGVVLVFRDVTIERDTEKELIASEERYRTVFENTGTGLLVLEHDTTIIQANKEAEKLTGYRLDEMEGKMSWTRLVSGQDLPRMLEYHRARRASGAEVSTQYEFTLLQRDGSHRCVFCSVDVIPGTARTIASLIDITERKNVEREILYLSFHDKLTGLYNRAFFEEELKRLDVKSRLPLSIILGDLNGLKLCNDAFGHTAGDKLLIKAAEILKEACGPEDIVARWGGDEFIILLPKESQSSPERVIERVKAACLEAKTVSISLGSAVKTDVDQDIYDVIHLAEDRMYRQKLTETASFRNSIISSLEGSLRERDYETEEHAQRIKRLTHLVGKALNLQDSQLDELTLLAALHDIGKLGIPDQILMKPGPLTKEEWEIMQRHAEIGYRIAASSPELAPIADAILAHHERWDGKGYPRRLRAEEIPLISRVLSVADSFDVMTHERPYKQAMSWEDALEEVQRCAGTQFDPNIAATFVEIMGAARAQAAVTGERSDLGKIPN